MLRLLAVYLRPYRTQLALVMVLLLAQALTNLALPNLNAAIINNGIAKGDIPYILRTGAVMLLFTVVMGITAVVGVYWGSKTSMAFGRDVRAAIFRKVETFSQTEVNRFSTASLITRNTNDVQQVQMVVLMGLNMMILAPILAIGGIIMAVREDAPLSLILLVVLPLMSVFIALMVKRAMPLFRAVQIKIDRINQVTRETLAGMRVIRAFVRTDYEERRFERANADLADTATRVGKIFAVMIPTLFGILNLSTVAVMWFGSLRVASGAMPIGNLTCSRWCLVPLRPPTASKKCSTPSHSCVTPRCRRPQQRRTGPSSFGTWTSATPTLPTRCCTASASRQVPAKSPRSLVAREAASPRW